MTTTIEAQGLPEPSPRMVAFGNMLRFSAENPDLNQPRLGLQLEIVQSVELGQSAVEFILGRALSYPDEGISLAEVQKVYEIQHLT